MTVQPRIEPGANYVRQLAKSLAWCRAGAGLALHDGRLWIMKAHPTAHNACPLAAVDQRLADAHHLWHQAQEAYFDPDGFRLAVQNAIQALRTVTFLLQKRKAIIPDFDNWYGTRDQPGGWQKRFGANALMRWMVDARNRIEKQGDLESYSMIRAEIVASYLDEGPRIEVPAHLADTVKILLRNIPDGAVGEHVRRHGVLRIQRRWVENTLPDHELLDAVAVAYGRIAELVHDAHRQIGLDPPYAIQDDAGRSYDLPAMGWRLPCMIGHELPRTLLISLADGSRIGLEEKQVPVPSDAAAVAAILKRYGSAPLEAMRPGYKTDAELAAGYFGLARRVFVRDGYHVTMLFLFRERKPIGEPIHVVFENVQTKYLIMRQLAHRVTRSGADAVMLVGEAWTASAAELKPYERPADSPARKEVLTLHMATKSGASFDCAAEIVRNGKEPSLGETRVAEGSAAFEFAPFFQAWGLPIPESWMEASVQILAAAKRE